MPPHRPTPPAEPAPLLLPCDRCSTVTAVRPLHHELLCSRCRDGRLAADLRDHKQDRTAQQRRDRYLAATRT